MIGRHDILFETSSPPELALEAIKVIRLTWSTAIIEDALTGDSLEQAMLGLAKTPEHIFIYRDTDVKKSWEVNGAVPENRNSMVHFVWDEKTLAVIVDDPNEKIMQDFLSSIGQIVSDISQLRLENLNRPWKINDRVIRLQAADRHHDDSSFKHGVIIREDAGISRDAVVVLFDDGTQGTYLDNGLEVEKKIK